MAGARKKRRVDTVLFNTMRRRCSGYVLGEYDKTRARAYVGEEGGMPAQMRLSPPLLLPTELTSLSSVSGRVSSPPAIPMALSSSAAIAASSVRQTNAKSNTSGNLSVRHHLTRS